MPTNDGSNIRNFPLRPLETGPRPPDDGDMEHRVTALETRLDTILPTLSTKADIEGVRGDINRWMLATTLTIIGTLVAAIIGLNTIWKSSTAPAAAQQAAPVIIQVPAYPALAPAPAPSSSTRH